MKKISPGFLMSNAAYTVKKSAIKFYAFEDRAPQVGDLFCGRVSRIGQHSRLENKKGRAHVMIDGSRAVFVYGNRYAPDHFEGYVPESSLNEVDMLAQSGIVPRNSDSRRRASSTERTAGGRGIMDITSERSTWPT